MELSITVNGEARAVPPRCTVAHLLQLMELSATRVAVERNREVVPRAEYAETVLADGDRLEVVTFVGGG
jgi:thiamine biosynthesis protein ThiS